MSDLSYLLILSYLIISTLFDYLFFLNCSKTVPWETVPTAGISKVVYCIVLYCIVLYCIVLYCNVLHSIAQYCHNTT